MISETWGTRLRALVIGSAVCAALGLAGSPAALATLGHPYLSQITGTPSEAFGESICGVTVDPASQDIYVGEAREEAVDIFNSAGVYQSQITGIGTPAGSFAGLICSIAVSDTTGEIYVAVSDPAVVYVFDALGAYLRTIDGSSTPAGSLGGGGVNVAVDQASGELYIADANDGVVDRFNAADEYQGEITGITQAGGMVTNAGGDIYVAEISAGEIREFDGAGSEIGHIDGKAVLGSFFEPLGGLAVDAAGNVYASDTEKNTVYEFGPTGALVAETSATDSEDLHNTWGVAFDSTGRMLVANSGAHAVDIFGPTVLLPTVTTDMATDVTNSSAALAGSVNPEGVPTTYQFEYGPSETYGAASPAAPASVGSDSSVHGLSAQLEKLTPNTTYHYRLVATNANGTSRGSDATFRTFGPVTVESEAAVEVETVEAAVSAEIDPQASATTYFFEYGASSAYGSSTAPASAGAGGETVAVAGELSGLQAGVLYHFRVVASNAFGVTRGADQTLMTPTGSSGLPDGRIYEMVTPVDNHDADVYVPEIDTTGNSNYGVSARLPFQAASDGSALTFAGDPSSEGTGAAGGGVANQYLARRSASGWSEQDISPYGRKNSLFEAFSADLSSAVLSAGLETSPIVSGAPAGYPEVLYQRDDLGGNLRSLITTFTHSVSPGEFGTRFAGGSEGFAMVAFEASAALIPGAPVGNDLYAAANGQLRLVNVLPSGAPEPQAAFGAPDLTGTEGSPDFSNDISADGSRMFWTGLASHGLYLSETGAPTVQIDASGAGGSGGGGQFWTANRDGSKAFFTDDASARLTADTQAGSGTNLYEYDADSHTLSDLTPAAQAGVQGVVGAGEGTGGTYVYFVANGALASGASAGQCEGINGSVHEGNQCVLYVWHDGTTRFVAALAETDGIAAQPFGRSGGAGDNGDWVQGVGHRTAEVTPDGETVVFTSTRRLTGYQNIGMTEAYVYDASSGELSCASCDPRGQLPQSSQLFGTGIAGVLPISSDETRPTHWLSDDGSRMFFDSYVPLVPEDTNGLLDVYEWERDGAGSCRLATGCVSLISNGKSDDNSYLLDTSADGDDVFFASRSRLVPADGDDAFNVFDARANGAPVPAPSACSGSGCQGVPPAPPIFATPASVTYDGVGNFPAPTQGAVKKAKPPTRAQKLERALRTCGQQRRGRVRKRCRTKAKARYGTAKAKRSAKEEK